MAEAKPNNTKLNSFKNFFNELSVVQSYLAERIIQLIKYNDYSGVVQHLKKLSPPYKEKVWDFALDRLNYKFFAPPQNEKEFKVYYQKNNLDYLKFIHQLLLDISIDHTIYIPTKDTDTTHNAKSSIKVPHPVYLILSQPEKNSFNAKLILQEHQEIMLTLLNQVSDKYKNDNEQYLKIKREITLWFQLSSKNYLDNNFKALDTFDTWYNHLKSIKNGKEAEELKNTTIDIKSNNTHIL